MGKVGSKVEGRVGRVGDMKRGGGEYPVSLLRNPYSTAMRHASLAFLLGEACCLRLRLEAKSSSQAGHECALSVDRGDLRGVCEI
jgi:hypothetical protein